MPEACTISLKMQLEDAHEIWEADREAEQEGVYLPETVMKKYPNAGKQWGWMWVFPSRRLSKDPVTGIVRRHHIHENNLQKTIKKATQAAEIPKQVKCHTLRDTPPPQLLGAIAFSQEPGMEIGEVFLSAGISS